MTIADKLTRLATAHDAIISAINAKGGSATGDGFEDFATDIAAIPSGPSINVEASKSVNVSASGTTTISPSTGYDAMAEAKAVVAAGSAATPATSITANPSISVSSGGLITASVSASQNVTPTVSAGWVSSGTAGAVSVSGSNTSQLTTQGAQTIYPSTSDQSISSGRYLTGAQTIKGVAVANLTAANIKKDVVVTIGDSADADRIMSVTGTYEGGGGKAWQAYWGYGSTKTTTYTASACKITVAKTGTYKAHWCAWRSSSNGTMGTRIYVNGTAVGTARETWIGTYGTVQSLSDLNLTADDEVCVYCNSGSTSRTCYAGDLVIEEQ